MDARLDEAGGVADGPEGRRGENRRTNDDGEWNAPPARERKACHAEYTPAGRATMTARFRELTGQSCGRACSADLPEPPEPVVHRRRAVGVGQGRAEAVSPHLGRGHAECAVKQAAEVRLAVEAV